MATEEQITNLAYKLWEQEGRPEGQHAEHYFRAKQILEEQEAAHVIELAPPPPVIELAPSPPIVLLAPSQPSKRRKYARRKKK